MNDRLRSPIPTLFVDTSFVSPYALSAFVALTEKGVEFDLQRVDLAAQQNQQQPFQQLSLTARVPTLDYDGFSLSESSAIIEFVEEEFAPPRYRSVLPADRRHRARARQLQAWLRSDLMALRAERPTTVFFATEQASPLTQAGKDAAGKLLRVAASLLRNGSRELFGAWSIADTDLAVMLNRLVAGGDRVPDPVRAYVDHQWERPSMRRWRGLVRL
ncbi:MAG: glutathione transferase [Burkholderiaceae bacterium]